MTEALFFLIVSFFLAMYLYDMLGKENDEDGELREKYSKLYTNHDCPTKDKSSHEYSQEALEVILDENLNEKLTALSKILPSFNLKDFLNKAEQVVKIVFNAYIDGDKKTLKTLLSEKTFKVFSENIDELLQLQQRVENSVFSIKDIAVYAIKMDKISVSLAIKFNSEQCNVIKNLHGDIVKGSLDHIKQHKEIWTFKKNLSSKSPIWVVQNIESIAQQNND